MTALTYEEAQERSRLIDVFGYHVELDVTGGDDMFGSVTVVRFGCRAPGAGSFIELSPARLRRVVLNGRDVDPATLTGNRLPLTGLRAVNELRVEADMRVLADRRGPAPLHRRRRRRDVPRAARRAGQRPAGLRRLRPAGPEGGHHRGGHGAATLDRDRERAGPARPVTAAGSWPPPRRSPPTCSRWWRARTTASAPSITASRSACTPGSRWPGIWTGTPRRFSPSPGPASTATGRSSPSLTRTTPTTRRSSPNSSPGRWRTPAA